eukprot:1146540-Pelagomonas_calceolata.AAC.5
MHTEAPFPFHTSNVYSCTILRTHMHQYNNSPNTLAQCHITHSSRTHARSTSHTPSHCVPIACVDCPDPSHLHFRGAAAAGPGAAGCAEALGAGGSPPEQQCEQQPHIHNPVGGSE